MNKPTVLLVDDDIDFVFANRSALEAAGYQVIVAHNGNDGMRLARENQVDVAILDVMMDTPEEGFILARNLRKDEKTKNIPLVMLTSVNEVNRKAGIHPGSQPAQRRKNQEHPAGNADLGQRSQPQSRVSLQIHRWRPRRDVASDRQIPRQAHQASTTGRSRTPFCALTRCRISRVGEAS
jgi:CheY-like chemotaxis protein